MFRTSQKNPNFFLSRYFFEQVHPLPGSAVSDTAEPRGRSALTDLSRSFLKNRK